MLYFGRDFFITLIVSALLAFILDPAVLVAMKLRLPRAAASALVMGIAFAGIYLAGVLLWTQFSTLTEDLPTYASRVNELVDKANTQLEALGQRTLATLVPKSLQQQQQQIEQKPKEALKARRRRAAVATQEVAQAPVVQEVHIHEDPKPIISRLYGFASRYFHVMIMASFVPFLVYFMLSWRDRMALSVLGLFHGEQRHSMELAWIGIGESTRAYVLGNFFLWLFLSSASAILFFFLGVPYWAIIGPLSAACSLVPYVGLPLSVLPPLLAAIAIPNKFKVVLALVILTATLHLIAMNFLYAKIIGRRVRLNPLVVTIALMFWGTVWGAVGLVLAVPHMGAIKAVCDNVDAWNGYGKLLGD